MDRVKELGNASVPFGFDVHAMCFSEDAPTLENAFHREFTDRRVNLVNLRKEYFQVGLDELEAFAQKQGVKMELTKLAEAREYRETLAIGEEDGKAKLAPAVARPAFPDVMPAVAAGIQAEAAGGT